MCVSEPCMRTAMCNTAAVFSVSVVNLSISSNKKKPLFGVKEQVVKFKFLQNPEMCGEVF